MGGVNELVGEEVDGEYGCEWGVKERVLEEVGEVVGEMEEEEGENDLGWRGSGEMLFMELVVLVGKRSLEEKVEKRG